MLHLFRHTRSYSFYSLRAPNNVAIVDQIGHRYTFDQLEYDVQSLRRGINPIAGSRVGILTGNNYSFIVSFLAIFQSRAICVPLCKISIDNYRRKSYNQGIIIYL